MRRLNRRETTWERITRRRNAWIESQGGKCVKCGSTDRLRVDHIDPTTKLYVIDKIWVIMPGLMDEELKKCQVLCLSCHSKKTGEERREENNG